MHLPPHTYLSLSELPGPEPRGREKEYQVCPVAVTKTAGTVQEGPPSLVPEEPVPSLAITPSLQEVTGSELFAGSFLPPIHQCSHDQPASGRVNKAGRPEGFPVHRGLWKALGTQTTLGTGPRPLTSID